MLIKKQKILEGINFFVGIVLGLVVLVGVVFAYTYVKPGEVTNPTFGPDEGNVKLDFVAGPQGPAGPAGSAGAAGPQGPQGIAGTFGKCQRKIDTCIVAGGASGYCTTNVVKVDDGWKVVGMDCIASEPGHTYGFLFATAMSMDASSISCRCHDVDITTSGKCNAVLWECQ